jgi:hypothetical protein
LRFGHNLTTGYGGGRNLHAIRGVGMRSQYAVRRRRNRCSSHHGSRSNLPCIHGNCRPSDGLPAPERLLRNRGDRTGNISVRIRDIVDGGVVIDDCCVIDVCNSRRIDSRVANVDAVHVFAAPAVRRHVHFARS